ncbi:MAG: hypothetical protein OEM42_01060 [Deltaproteobacteria bacterium]|nr:hypothetical protein [Deltaproteobacteria bacterium]MDH3382628.1 hypothetical protein [Deltaproteobacteria bacterium]
MARNRQFLRFFCVLTTVFALSIALGVRPGIAHGDSDEDGGRFCSRTAWLAFAACGNEVRDDSLVADAICVNISDKEDRKECIREAKRTRKEELESCIEQRNARLEVCEAIGEERYDPDFDPESFEVSFNNNNPYLPLTIGNSWTYEGGSEKIVVEVMGETKLIEGVMCIVVRDQVWDEDKLVEDTNDWEAQAKNGDVWYCGEEVKDYETFEGDEPPLPELVAIDGSFKAGRNGDKAGILFPMSPEVGQVYRQEFSLGNAEDVAEVLTTTFACDGKSEFDEFVPDTLKNFCQGACEGGDCVVTKEWSPLEPGVFEWKYFAPGVGMFLEANPDTRDTVELVGCTVSELCKSL